MAEGVGERLGGGPKATGISLACPLVSGILDAMDCLDDAALLDFVEGRASAKEALAIEEHVDRCRSCRELLAEAARGLSIDSAGGSGEGPVSPESPVSARRGTSVGRYVVLDRIGQGSMGIVYSAYDPELHRKLALKILRPNVSAQLGSDGARARVLREAQAMARLTHANVIAVYDCGTVDGQVFVAMELSDGETLTAWLRSGPRDWREVLDRFAQAGRGLSAAHAAGIVHRDFKPDNVLCGLDGRVRVTDFGLARVAHVPPPANDLSPPEGEAVVHLTRSGALVGTPAYMAPEQLAGRAPDARSDQFSFCVALHEALYGERPFAGGTIGELAEAIERGSVREPPKKARVPAAIRRSLLRGLAARPEDRFPSMDELLSALGKDPAAPRRRAAIAAVAIAALAALSAGGYHLRSARPELCGGAELKLVGIWDPARKASVKTALLSTGLPYAERTSAGVEQILDDYGRRWAVMHTETCEATRVRGEQSEEVLDLRMMCLSQRLGAMRASTDLLAGGDKDVVEKAVRIAEGLPPLSECADVEALTRPLRPPKDATLRAKVEEVREQIAKAKALEDGGRYTQGISVAEASLAGARATGYTPLTAEALAQLGRLRTRSTTGHEAAEGTLEEAFFAAVASRHDRIAVRASAALVDYLTDAERRGRLTDAQRWGRIGSAMLEQSHTDPMSEALLRSSLGDLRVNEEKYDEALDEYRHALRLTEEKMGPDHGYAATIRDRIANALGDQGKYEEGLAEHRRALAIVDKTLGPDHPAAGHAHNNISVILAAQGDYPQALAEGRRALSIWERALGPDHPLVAAAHLNIAVALGQEGGLEEAILEYRRSLAIYSKAFGEESPDVANCHNDIGLCLIELGRSDEALTELRRACAIWEKTVGPEDRDLVNCYGNLGDALFLQGKYKEALDQKRRALTLFEKSLGPDHPRTAEVRGWTGVVYLALRALPEAVEHLRRALSVLEVKQPNPILLGEFRFALARALWDRKERAPALELARKAREDTAQLQHREKKLSEIDDWLAAHHGE